MVNRAIEELVVSKFGDDKWDAIKAKAGVDVDVFISNEGYPDEMTYRLVEAASQVLGLPADDVLVAFGEHWVLETAQKGYGGMMAAGGRTLAEFLTNLANFHTRVVMVLPKLQPPHFECSDVTERSLRLHYHTHRGGLTSFVVGLLSGLGKMYRTPVRVSVAQRKGAGADHDIFDVEWDGVQPA
ncbi:MAG: heme NO-binding domain-containing protein [Roseimicrobium sp.]